MSQDDNEDEFLNEDIPGNDRKVKKIAKRQVIMNYESDSSDEDYVKEEEDHSHDESDDDMFASDEEEKKKQDPVKNSKGEDILDMREFEISEGIADYRKEVEYPDGTEDSQINANDYYNNIENLDSGGGVSIKKPDAKLEAFDLREEVNEGVFYKDGTYVRNKDGEDTKDGEEWLNDYKWEDIEKAKKAERERERKLEKKISQMDKNSKTTEELLNDLIALLEPAETPIEAIARISPRRKRKKNVQDKQNSNHSSKELVIRITEICNELMNVKAIEDASLMSKEELMRIFKSETGHDFIPEQRGVKRKLDADDSVNEDNDQEHFSNTDYGEKTWEFRWKDDDAVHGPYSAYEMEHWKHNYFNNEVFVRKLGSDHFDPVETVSFK